MTQVLFITGFNRSGTTLLTSAVTQAAQARTLTVGDLARHLPSVQRFLTTASKHGTVTDRGVDRLPVSETTPEEYGWLLNAVTGDFAFGEQAAQAEVLHSLVDELAGAGPATVVLKNPWDTGRERLLLDHFPGARVLLVRRDLSAIEDSQSRAWKRMATSNRYVRALMSDPHSRAQLLATILDPVAQQRMVRDTRRRMRMTAVRLARSVARLPLDRVAFVSYDELRADPFAGAAWAAHIVDPGALGEAIATHTFPEYNQASAPSLPARLIDWYWARAWRRARARQIRAGILTGPGRPRAA
ncbi:MAG: sulfotransferase [Micromonosporaceae bacterium]